MNTPYHLCQVLAPTYWARVRPFGYTYTGMSSRIALSLDMFNILLFNTKDLCTHSVIQMLKFTLDPEAILLEMLCSMIQKWPLHQCLLKQYMIAINGWQHKYTACRLQEAKQISRKFKKVSIVLYKYCSSHPVFIIFGRRVIKPLTCHKRSQARLHWLQRIDPDPIIRFPSFVLALLRG